MTDDLRNEIAEICVKFGADENASGDVADAILAKMDPDSLIVAALERSAGYISRAIDCVTSGTYDQSDPRIEQLCEYADDIRALVAQLKGTDQ